MNPRKVRFVTLAASATFSVAVVPALSGCAAEPAGAEGASPAPTQVARAAEPADSVLVLGSADPAELALTASQTFFDAAPVVVLAAAGDVAAQATAAAVAAPLTAPVLLVGGGISDGGVRTELDRLGAVAVVEVAEDPVPPGGAQSGGADASDDGSEALEGLDDVTSVRLDVDALTPEGEIDPRDLEDLQDALPARGEADVLTEVLVLSQPGEAQVAAVATARAAGALPVEVAGGDPRADASVVETISQAKALAVVGIGAEFGTSQELGWRVRAAESGVLLPSGTQLVLAGDARYVAVGADAVTSRLEAVDAEDAAEALADARTAADAFAAESGGPAVPVVEVRATRSSSSAGTDGDYSTEVPADELRPFVDAAAAAGVHVVLSFEPGRATFDEQVAEYAGLLALPGVGVALDVSARRGAVRSGTVDAAEVEAVAVLLGETVRSGALPQKLLVVQTPAADAVRGLADLDAGAGELAVVVQSIASGGYERRVDAWDGVVSGSPTDAVPGWTTGSSDPALDVAGVLALEPAPRYVAAAP
ncbi:hypothetical protein [Cellulosimicrobium sp. Marseille-Q4280]|uniref:hypothetical protein n=1 Tax=Cellulosimicrobium sp. Marseille-Q4280 TaxID=2937992 RepID=UPI00203F9207|nr:hypothetical protein [Cellulosimicrobium sp. Marseille-Q4280]